MIGVLWSILMLLLYSLSAIKQFKEASSLASKITVLLHEVIGLVAVYQIIFNFLH